MYIYFILRIITLSFILFPNYSSFGHWETLQVGFSVLKCLHPFFSTSFLLAPQIFHSHLVFSLLQSGHQPLLQGALVPFIGKNYLETKIWVPAVLTITGMSLLLGCLIEIS